MSLPTWGVAIQDGHEQQLQHYPHWLALFPLEAAAEPVAIGERTAVMFDIRSADLAPDISVEMLRLGNDRQSYRQLNTGEATRLLLRVIGPPYYTLLRVLESASTGVSSGATLRAYSEQAPRVWVQLGYSHPLASSLAGNGKLGALGTRCCCSNCL